MDMVWEVTPLDYVCFFEDMAYNHGCFISPKTFDEFLMPYYHELVAYLRAKGVKKVLVDSDGNSVQLTDKLVEAGWRSTPAPSRRRSASAIPSWR